MPIGIYERTKEVSKETREKMSKNNAHYWLGKKRSEESKKKQSETTKGTILSDEHRKKIGDAIRGFKHTVETRKKMSEVAKNRKYTKATREKMSKSQLKKDDEISYSRIHGRIVKKYSKAIKCENIMCEKISKKYEWSNKDHKYSLNINDWQQLCKPCHAKYDKRFGKIGNNQYNKK